MILLIPKSNSPTCILLLPPLSRVTWALLASADLVESQQVFPDWKSPPTPIRVLVVAAVGGKKIWSSSPHKMRGIFQKG